MLENLLEYYRKSDGATKKKILVCIFAEKLVFEKGWYEIIGEKTIADAILDRLVHQSHRIELEGESMRRKRKKISEEKV
jgi:hypothetical protein